MSASDRREVWRNQLLMSLYEAYDHLSGWELLHATDEMLLLGEASGRRMRRRIIDEAAHNGSSSSTGTP